MKEWHNFSLKGKKHISPVDETDILINGPHSKKSSSPTRKSTKPQKTNKIETLANAGKGWSNGLRGEIQPKKKTIGKKKPISQFEPTSIASKKQGSMITNFHLDEGHYNFCIDKEDIKSYLNGIGRIVEFGTTHRDRKGHLNPTIDANSNYVISISEGNFENGQFSGFVRNLDNEGECKLGYWKMDTTTQEWAIPVSRPYGKFVHYNKDGSFKTPEGMYLGNDLSWNYLL